MVVYIMTLKKATPKSSLDLSKRGPKELRFSLNQFMGQWVSQKKFEYHLVWLSALRKFFEMKIQLILKIDGAHCIHQFWA